MSSSMTYCPICKAELPTGILRATYDELELTIRNQETINQIPEILARVKTIEAILNLFLKGILKGTDYIDYEWPSKVEEESQNDP